MKFSVLMSVYRNDRPEFVAKAVHSIFDNQTVKPSEIILMVDGPVSQDLEYTIRQTANEIPELRPIWNDENQGLGKVLGDGLIMCSNEIVARMDADDVSVPTRFEKQIKFLNEHPDIVVVGGQISEFIDREENIVGYRIVPVTPDECRNYFQDRDPLNHVTVMFRKSAVLDAGNYQSWHFDEDTYLWGRILKKGYDVANIPEVLVNVRVGHDMYARRGGWTYFKSDSGILKWKLDNELTSYGRFCYNYIIRFFVQVLMPNRVRGWFFKAVLRKQ